MCCISKMFSLLCKSIKVVSVLRRLQFSSTFYPKGMPFYWESVFSARGREVKNDITPENARHIIENMELLDQGALTSDEDLTTEILRD